MPLHTGGIVTRRQLDHPEEPISEPVAVPAYEHVLKFNPNHGPDGRFASSGGGRRGGTVGPPTTGAFGQPLGGRYAPTQRSMDAGFSRGGPAVTTPGFHRGGPAVQDPNFNRGVGDAEMAGSTPYQHTSGLFNPSPATRVPQGDSDATLRTQGWSTRQITEYRGAQATNWTKGRANLPKYR